MKQTSICKNCKKSHTYVVRKKKIYNVGFFCSNCRKEEQRALQKKYPKVAKERDLLKCFGITLKEYKLLFKRQNGRCAICGRKEFRFRNGKRESLGVDHNHTTGKNRGLLCHTCNSAIGLLKESSKLLMKAIKYLQQYN